MNLCPAGNKIGRVAMFILSILAKSRLYFLCGVITVGYLFSPAIKRTNLINKQILVRFYVGKTREF